MNKELIKKYKDEFDHWLNGGKVLSKQTLLPEWSNCQDENIWKIPSNNITKVLIVIDDEYVEFRKALAEGKVVQKQDYYSKQWIDMKNDNFHSASDTQYEGVYRIKPEEPKFKVGDWVIHNGVVKQVTKVVDGLIDCLDNKVAVIMKEESLELWEPKPGEWCWVFNKLRGIPVLRRVVRVENNFKNRYDNVKFTKAVRVGREDYLDEEVGYRFCEPFIGQLPTSI